MRVSVIIPTRNRCAALKRGIEALLADPYPDKEILVADGLSTDGTQDMLASFGDAVRWVSQADGGEFIARNRALRMATGQLVRNLSDDDVHVPGTMRHAVDFFGENPKTDLLFGQCVTYYVPVDGPAFVIDDIARNADCVTLRNFVRGNRLLPKSEAVYFRRSLPDRIGPFDQVRGGDYEFWARAAHHGFSLRTANAVYVHGYRYEAGENRYHREYRDLVYSWKMLAARHGDRADRLYVALVTPLRLLKYDLLQCLPAPLARRLRETAWARLRQRHGGEALLRSGLNNASPIPHTPGGPQPR